MLDCNCTFETVEKNINFGKSVHSSHKTAHINELVQKGDSLIEKFACFTEKALFIIMLST